MNEQFDEINLYNYYKIIIKRKNIIIFTVLLATVLSFAISYFSPKIYESRSIIRIPVIHDSRAQVTQTKNQPPIVSSSELKLMVENFKSSYSKNIVSLNITSINDNSEEGPVGDFNLIVQVKDNPQLAVRVSNEILIYLKDNEFTKNKINEKKTILNNKILNINKTLGEALKIKSNVKSFLENRSSSLLEFNPVEIEAKMNELEDKKTDLEVELKSLNGFEFVVKPNPSDSPVKPKSLQNTVLGFVFSLFLSIFLVFFVEWLDKNKASYDN